MTDRPPPASCYYGRSCREAQKKDFTRRASSIRFVDQEIERSPLNCTPLLVSRNDNVMLVVSWAERVALSAGGCVNVRVQHRLPLAYRKTNSERCSVVGGGSTGFGGVGVECSSAKLTLLTEVEATSTWSRLRSASRCPCWRCKTLDLYVCAALGARDGFYMSTRMKP